MVLELDDYVRWLDLKEVVDRRSFNMRVMRKVKKTLQRRRFLKVLDCGTGTGSLVRILIDNGLIVKGEIVAIDKERYLLLEARKRFYKWAKKRGFKLLFYGSNDEEWKARLLSQNIRLDILFMKHDVYDLRKVEWEKFDLVTGMSLLDLLNPEKALDALLSVISKGGLIYLLLNYDHATIFEPTLDKDREELLLKAYEQTMIRRYNSEWEGDPYIGRKLLHLLTDKGLEILGYGPSDWVVYPRNKSYQTNEKMFLKYILKIIEDALTKSSLKEEEYSDWIRLRLKQLETGELIYICHQMDIAGMLKSKQT